MMAVNKRLGFNFAVLKDTLLGKIEIESESRRGENGYTESQLDPQLRKSLNSREVAKHSSLVN
jgi:hypothetical protein